MKYAYHKIGQKGLKLQNLRITFCNIQLSSEILAIDGLRPPGGSIRHTSYLLNKAVSLLYGFVLNPRAHKPMILYWGGPLYQTTQEIQWFD